jgi:hypothetical protein
LISGSQHIKIHAKTHSRNDELKGKKKTGRTTRIANRLDANPLSMGKKNDEIKTIKEMK